MDSPYTMACVVSGQEVPQEGVGRLIGSHFFVTENRADAVLQMGEAAFDFAFGLRVRGHAMIDAQAQESALELAAGLDLRFGAGGAKEAQGVGVDGGGKSVALEGGTEVTEVPPSGVGRHETARDQLARVIVFGENEGLFLLARPPLMNGTVVLPKLADLGALPAPPGARQGARPSHKVREMSGDMANYGGAGTNEAKARLEFIGDQSAVQRLASRQECFQESGDFLGPAFSVIAARSPSSKPSALPQPLPAELVKTGPPDPQTLLRAQRVDLTTMEGGENFTDHRGRNTVLDLTLFTTPSYPSLPRPHRLSSASATLRLTKACAESVHL